MVELHMNSSRAIPGLIDEGLALSPWLSPILPGCTYLCPPFWRIQGQRAFILSVFLHCLQLHFLIPRLYLGAIYSITFSDILQDYLQCHNIIDAIKIDRERAHQHKNLSCGQDSFPSPPHPVAVNHSPLPLLLLAPRGSIDIGVRSLESMGNGFFHSTQSLASSKLLHSLCSRVCMNQFV